MPAAVRAAATAVEAAARSATVELAASAEVTAAAIAVAAAVEVSAAIATIESTTVIAATAIISAATVIAATIAAASVTISAAVIATPVISVIPGTGADERAADEPIRSVETIRRASVGVVIVVSVGANRSGLVISGHSNSNAEGDALGLRERSREETNAE